MSDAPPPPAIVGENRKRPRDEEDAEPENANGTVTSEAKTTASDDGVSSIGQDDASAQLDAPPGQAAPRNYAIPPFVPDQKAYEAGLEHARNLARASRARKKEAVERSRIRSKELLIEREQLYRFLMANDIPALPAGAGATFSLSSLDASELFASLQNMDEQDHQLMNNKQRISDARMSAGMQTHMTEEQLEILRKDRNRIHAKKARLKRKIIAQELYAIERKLEDELYRIREYASHYVPNVPRSFPDLKEKPDALVEALEKIDSLAKYGDILVSGGPESVAIPRDPGGIGATAIPVLPSPQVSRIAYTAPARSGAALPASAQPLPGMMPPGMGYGFNPPPYPQFYPTPERTGDPESMWGNPQFMMMPAGMSPQGSMYFPSGQHMTMPSPAEYALMYQHQLGLAPPSNYYQSGPPPPGYPGLNDNRGRHM